MLAKENAQRSTIFICLTNMANVQWCGGVMEI